MGTKLSKAPVYYTVAQVQFNPILDLETYLPSIQAKMREDNFPDFKPEVMQRVSFQLNGISDTSQSSVPMVRQSNRYSFGNISGRTGFLLDVNSLSLQTTEYDTFESFLSSFVKALKILNESLHLAYVERIGLRYLDAVYPLKTEDKLSAYLVPEVLGLSHTLEGTLRHSISETMRSMGIGQLISRVIIRDGRIGFPEDVVALPLNQRFEAWDKLHAIIDSDAFHIHREAFNVDEIESKLQSLHDIIEQAFRSTVTDHARAAWA